MAALEVPFLDRMVFERLFTGPAKRSHWLMHTFGAYQSGQFLLIDRSTCLTQLEALEASSLLKARWGRQAQG